jgi:hypothetical protein
MRESEHILSVIYEFCVYLKLFEKSNYNCFVFLIAQVMAVYAVNFNSLFECGAQLEWRIVYRLLYKLNDPEKMSGLDKCQKMMFDCCTVHDLWP